MSINIFYQAGWIKDGYYLSLGFNPGFNMFYPMIAFLLSKFRLMQRWSHKLTPTACVAYDELGVAHAPCAYGAAVGAFYLARSVVTPAI